MSVKKITTTIYRCTCELPDCGKSWRSVGAQIPERCRWCGRRTWNGQDLRPKHLVTAKGKTQCISDWAKDTGLSKQTIRARIIAGWKPEEAVSIAAGKERKRG